MTSLEIRTQADDDSGIVSAVQGNTRFALSLYQRLRTTEGNLFYSPYSISAALAMTYAGARGETAAQMARVLCLPPGTEAVHSAFAALKARLAQICEQGQMQLKTANSLWPDQSFKLSDAFAALARLHYGVAIAGVDYRDPKTAAATINAWVEGETADMIRNLVTPDMFARAVLVLVNAIYFKGAWASRFDARHTRPATFQIAPAEHIEVETMTQTHRFRYAQIQGLQVLELPYAGEFVAMILLLPDSLDGQSKLEDSLTPENLDAWNASALEQEVQVFLPRLDLSQSFGLGQTLQAMGMTDAFGRADFSGIGEGPLVISDVVHKAAITANEEGSEAAAATAVIMSRGGTVAPPIFRADHPFLFLIREKGTGSILFIGRVTNPASEETNGQIRGPTHPILGQLAP